MTRSLICLGVLTLALAIVIFPLLPIVVAFADAIDSGVAEVCANDGAVLKWLGRAGMAMGGAAIIANLQWVQATPYLGPTVRFLAGHWRDFLRLAMANAPAAKSLVLALVLLPAALVLSACQLTGNVAADAAAANTAVQQFAPQVAAFDVDAQSKITAFNAGVVTDAAAVGKSACGYASMADGLFALAAPIAIAAGAAPGIGASEAAVMGGVNLACGVLDAADPTTPATTVATAAAAVIAAIPQVKANLQAASPGAAAAATAPAASAPAKS
jgi:hypothetical protein